MRGWLLDLYPGAPGEMVVWFKLGDGSPVRLVDRWSPSFFVAAEDESDLRIPLQILGGDLLWTRAVERYEKVTDLVRTRVTEAKLKDAKRTKQVAERLERLGQFGAFRLYNVDIPPNQSYLYEKDIFPLAYCEVTQKIQGLEWELCDDVSRYSYSTPPLKTMKLDVTVSKEGKIPRLGDKIREIRLEEEGQTTTIDGGTEKDRLLRLVDHVKDGDPDFVITHDGDTFLFPYLIRRAEVNGVSGSLTLDRDGTIMKTPTKRGTSYFSYGRIHYKPSAIKLFGRIHIDVNTSFAYSEAGLEGLYELSRVCRMPMHTSSRASIGKALSSLQFYHASKADLLVPWKPTLVESFKDRNELMLADRGGFIFEPKMGVHEGVAELDFNALYPNIMYRKNISAETVRCSCCPDSTNRVPELDWNVCQKRRGIVPRAIEIIVKKRLGYKRLKHEVTVTEEERIKHGDRQGVLKWLGVTTFGYLGFNNAKFGRIDAHIAVCAWDRKILVEAANVAEEQGFEVVHGIVDSLWVKKKGASEEDYLKLKAKIENRTGFTMAFEGIYKWVVFLPSKVDPSIPVLNRYFGAYKDGRLKVRGIETRRHDTPRAFAQCQTEIVTILAGGNTIKEAAALIPQCVAVFLAYAKALERREIPTAELAFTTNLSKGPDEYSTNTVQHAAVKQLVKESVELHAGEGIRYIITDYRGHDSKRATPLDVVDGEAAYDSKRYIFLLAQVCASVLQPFAAEYSAEELLRTYERSSHLTLTGNS